MQRRKAERRRLQTVARADGLSTSDIGDEDLPPGLIRSPDAKLAANLQTTMLEHCLKRYGIRTCLVLDGSWPPLASAEDAPMILVGLSKPANCRYARCSSPSSRNRSSDRIFFRLER
jgi:hypothetical protein